MHLLSSSVVYNLCGVGFLCPPLSPQFLHSSLVGYHHSSTMAREEISFVIDSPPFFSLASRYPRSLYLCLLPYPRGNASEYLTLPPPLSLRVFSFLTGCRSQIDSARNECNYLISLGLRIRLFSYYRFSSFSLPVFSFLSSFFLVAAWLFLSFFIPFLFVSILMFSFWLLL